jgi:DNA polymerase (family X)
VEPACSTTGSRPRDSSLDNQAIARVFGEIADLLEIKGENLFKIRAYRNAADVIATCAEAVGLMSDVQIRALSGVGKDLALKIREIVTTGQSTFHQELLAEFPSTMLDLLTLQGVGPKTVALLYSSLDISSLEALEAAAKAGRIRELKGMGSKKEQLILRALNERRAHAGRRLLAEVANTAVTVIEHLRERAPTAQFEPVGSLRRGQETCGDLDILAIGADVSIMDSFTTQPLTERIIGKGETKSSVLLQGGLQADLRLVSPDNRGAALQYFTGSKSHNIVLRDRALQRGLKLNEYGLYRTSDDSLVAGTREEDIYEALDLAWVPPELRENRGEIEAAQSRSLPALVELRDIRGDVHSHTTETDGRDSIEAMIRAARDAGLEYMAVTDHSQSLAMANGLDERRTLAHAARIREVASRIEGITVFAGIECDIRPDGTLDLAEDCLASLDLVIASVHSALNQDDVQMTERMLRAIESPVVDIVGHPTGRLLLRREPSRVSVTRLIEAAARLGVALEINSLPDRLDLGDVHARLARERGVKLLISSDSHASGAFAHLRWGVATARRAWLTKADVLNTMPASEFRASLRRHKR